MTPKRTRTVPWVLRLALLLGWALLLSGPVSCKKKPKNTGHPRSRLSTGIDRVGKSPAPKPKTPAEAIEEPRDTEPLEGQTHVERYPDRWYLRMRHGGPTGYNHVQLSYIHEDGRRLIRDETEAASWFHRKIAHMDDTFTTKAVMVYLRAEDGELIEAESEVERGEGWDQRLEVTTMKKEEEGYRFTMEMVERKVEKFHACDKKMMMDGGWNPRSSTSGGRRRSASAWR
ncbi:MAG: hypothetical protein ACYTHM_25715 [Planctomycetota bacterium]|jgi:hypothetical protein